MLSKKVMAVFNQFNGTLPTSVASEFGINRETLRKAALRGDIEKVNRGIYILTDAIEDNYFSNQCRYSKGIYSHESALYLWNYGTHLPERYSMTFPQGYHAASFQKNLVDPYTVKPKFYSLGKTEIETGFGNKVTIYDKERTFLDMMYEKKVRTFLVEEMLDDYFYDEDKNLENLYHYAQVMQRMDLLKGVEDKIM